MGVSAKTEEKPVQEKTPEVAQALEFAFITRMLDDPVVEVPRCVDEGVEEDWFDDARCRAVWRAAKNLWAHADDAPGTATSALATDDIDPMVVINEAKRVILSDPKEFGAISVDISFYDMIADCSARSGALGALVPSLREAAMKRRMRAAFTEVSKIVATGGTADDAVGELSRRIADIQAMKVAASDAGCHELVLQNFKAWKHAKKEWDAGNRNFVIGLPLPWPDLSRRLRGLQTGMHVIAARPSVGKTSFGMQIAISLVRSGWHVGFNSLDMPVRQLMKRPVSALSRVPLSKLDNGNPTEEEIERVKKAADEIADWEKKGLFMLTSRASVYDFASWCSVKKAEGHLDCVFVDYIQKMNAGRRLTGEQAMKEVSAVTSTIAKRLQIPVVALAQLNRSNERDENGERDPRISDIRESGTIEQDAFTIMLLSVDAGVRKAWQNNPPTGLTLDGDGDAVKPVWVNLAKNQNGQTGQFPFVVYENTFTWMLGDVSAPKVTNANGNSVSGVNENKFTHITPDGRDPDFESFLAKAGYLRDKSTPVPVTADSKRAPHDPLAPSAPPPNPYAPPSAPAWPSSVPKPSQVVTDFSSIESEFTDPVLGVDPTALF